MPDQIPLLVPKPQVQFSERLTDPNLRGLTVAQLRKEARKKKLNVSLFTYKWEFIHVLVLERTCGKEAFVQHISDTKRRNIFDLPGEIRNKIYDYILINDGPVIGLYQYQTAPKSNPVPAILTHLHQTFIRKPETPAEKSCRKQRSMISDLRNMSWANRELRREIFDFFFSRNVFEVTGNMASAYSNFLSDIGIDGRASIVNLKLSGMRSCVFKECLASLSRSCVNLHHLTMRLHISRILEKESYELLSFYMVFDFLDLDDNILPVMLDSDMLSFFEVIGKLPYLEFLDSKTVLPRWWKLSNPKRLKLLAPKESSPEYAISHLLASGIEFTVD